MSPNTLPCPTCRQPAVWNDNPDRPFCSERCRLIDLGAWASEAYRVPCDSLTDVHGSDSAPSHTDD